MRVISNEVRYKLLERVFGAYVYWWTGEGHDRVIFLISDSSGTVSAVMQRHNQDLIRHGWFSDSWRKRCV